jgi:serine/threonine protein kinase
LEKKHLNAMVDAPLCFYKQTFVAKGFVEAYLSELEVCRAISRMSAPCAHLPHIYGVANMLTFNSPAQTHTIVQPVLATEFMRGVNLHKWLKDDVLQSSWRAQYSMPRSRRRERIKIAMQLLQGMIALQKLDIVHRDMSPSNVMIMSADIYARRFEKFRRIGVFTEKRPTLSVPLAIEENMSVDASRAARAEALAVAAAADVAAAAAFVAKPLPRTRARCVRQSDEVRRALHKNGFDGDFDVTDAVRFPSASSSDTDTGYRVVIIDFNISIVLTPSGEKEAFSVEAAQQAIAWTAGTFPYLRLTYMPKPSSAKSRFILRVDAIALLTMPNAYWRYFDHFAVAQVLCDLFRGYPIDFLGDGVAVREAYHKYCQNHLKAMVTSIAKRGCDARLFPTIVGFLVSEAANLPGKPIFQQMCIRGMHRLTTLLRDYPQLRDILARMTGDTWIDQSAAGEAREWSYARAFGRQRDIDRSTLLEELRVALHEVNRALLRPVVAAKLIALKLRVVESPWRIDSLGCAARQQAKYHTICGNWVRWRAAQVGGEAVDAPSVWSLNDDDVAWTEKFNRCVGQLKLAARENSSPLTHHAIIAAMEEWLNVWIRCVDSIDGEIEFNLESHWTDTMRDQRFTFYIYRTYRHYDGTINSDDDVNDDDESAPADENEPNTDENTPDSASHPVDDQPLHTHAAEIGADADNIDGVGAASIDAGERASFDKDAMDEDDSTPPPVDEKEPNNDEAASLHDVVASAELPLQLPSSASSSDSDE